MKSNPQTDSLHRKYAPYIAGLVKRERQRRRQLRKRAEQAMKVARQAAALLRQHFNVKRVRLFGSVLYPERFHEQSDIDLAIEGLPARDYLKAWALLNGGSPDFEHDFEIDLIDRDDCLPYIWRAVEQEGFEV
jgi:predicted nucleotidyltransferase